MVNTAGQVKRATDAAALAIGQIQLRNDNSDETDLTAIAKGYVLMNLGMDSDLQNQVSDNFVKAIRGESDGATTYTVTVTLNANSDLLEAQSETLVISSTVEVVTIPTEVALMLPNTLSEDDSELSALRTLGKSFARELLGEDDSSLFKSMESLYEYAVEQSVLAVERMLDLYDEPGYCTPPDGDLRGLSFIEGGVNNVHTEPPPNVSAPVTK